jgi:hypothetical protein
MRVTFCEFCVESQKHVTRNTQRATRDWYSDVAIIPLKTELFILPLFVKKTHAQETGKYKDTATRAAASGKKKKNPGAAPRKSPCSNSG